MEKILSSPDLAGNHQAMGVNGEQLLDGPRGRRLLLEFALRSAERAPDQCAKFGKTVHHAGRQLDPDGDGQRYLAARSFSASRWFRRVRRPGLIHGLPRLWWPKRSGKRRSRRFAPYLDAGHLKNSHAADRGACSPNDVAELLAELPLTNPDGDILLRSLVESADRARYWQEPDGEDVLTANPVVRDALARVAEHITNALATHWWSTPLARDDQWTVHWVDERTNNLDAEPQDTPAQRLAQWRSHELEAEQRARRERPRDPSASFSGEWWSAPPRQLTQTTRNLGDRGPAGLWLIEDGLGWERATVGHVTVPEQARIYEIDGADAWAQLCRRAPIEVTAGKQHDWYRTTGRAGRWVIPDWSQVAEAYDGVHLTVTGYLAAAGTAIPVDGDTASVIGGWGPDETHWLTDSVTRGSDSETWAWDGDSGSETWRFVAERTD